MIGMRVVEPEQFTAKLAGPPLGETIVRRPHEKSPPWALLRRVRERNGMGDLAAGSNERAATLVRERLLAVATYRGRDRAHQLHRLLTHRRSRTTRSDTSRRRRETPSR